MLKGLGCFGGSGFKAFGFLGGLQGLGLEAKTAFEV